GIMSGLDYYMNDAGLLCSETTIAQTRFDADAAPLASRIRRVMQYADSIDKAVEILTASNNGLYSNEWLLGDTKTNEVAMFELGTRKHKLWRSSKREFPGGTEGFYWGCNNTKDLDVRTETVASLAAKPANLVFHPTNRDVAWLKLFDESRGKIDAKFGFKAFTTPPLAAFRSCDAKFTTTALAKELKSWALFGPPLGRTWDATPEEQKRLSEIQPLVSNDWAMMRVDAVTEPPAQLAKAIDLAPFPKPERSETNLARGDRPRVLPAAWRGTLLPAGDADIWLAAAFSDYERIVALEKSLKAKAKDHKLDREAERQLAVARFGPFSRWHAAARRLGRDVPLGEIQADWKTNEWYSVAAGKGVHLLAALRTQLGSEAFDKALDEFGREHAGKEVSTREFREHLEKTAGQSLSSTFDPWLSGPSSTDSAGENFWSVESFEVEPERTLIVYGTLADRDTQREAAELLARKVARRFSNALFNIVRDDEVSDADLKEHHLLLVGRPAANSVTERLAAGLPVRFGAGSFVFNGETYANSNSGVIAAGPNRLNERYSAVVFAGLSASATRRVVEGLPGRAGEAAEVLLLRAGHATKAYRAARASLETAMP
ncbi:MAG TPA: M1 family aminopeptidase, partial [Pirellulales bacterium]